VTCQRWEGGRDSRRPAGEPIRTAEYDVREISELEAKAFIATHHYSHAYPAARFRFGLFHRGELVGVAVFSRPFTPETITNVFPTIGIDDGVELGRFVLLDEVPGNGETWFLARCFDALRGRVAGVVSFADPWPRTRVDDSIVFPGHIGTIYQAKNATYHGLTDARTIRLLPDGTVFSNFQSGKIRRRLSGWRSAVAELIAYGAEDLGEDAEREERIEWLESWRDALTRPMRHRGNHRYSWRLDEVNRTERVFGPIRAYPKMAVR
jgi:ribosome modulation factor